MLSDRKKNDIPFERSWMDRRENIRMRREGMKIGVKVCILLSFFVSLFLVRAGGEEAPPLEETLPPGIQVQILVPGALAPPFRLSDLSGKAYSFSGTPTKKAHLILFWSMFCRPCRKVMKSLNKINGRFFGKGLEIVAISMDGEPLQRVVAGFVMQEKYSYKVLLDQFNEDETFEVARRYGITSRPSLFLINRKGEITYMKTGVVTAREVEQQVVKALSR